MNESVVIFESATIFKRVDLSRPWQKLTRITFHTPEQPRPQTLPVEVSKKRINITVPKFLVYGVVEIGLE